MRRLFNTSHTVRRQLAVLMSVGALGLVSGVICARPAVAASPVDSSLVRELKKVDQALQANARAQPHADYYFNAVTIIIGIAAGFVSILAVAATVMGYRIVRTYINSELGTYTRNAYEELGRPAVTEMLTDADAALRTLTDQTRDEVTDTLERFRKVAKTGRSGVDQ